VKIYNCHVQGEEYRRVYMRNKNKLSYWIKIILGIIIAVIFILPIYIMASSALKPTTEVFDLKLIPKTITLSGFQYALGQNFLRYFLNSFFISIVVTVIALIFHAMAGYALARLNFKGKDFVFLWVISTLMIPFSVIMIPLFIMVKELNWLNTFRGVIIPAIPHAYGIFLFRQYYSTMPKELEEAATIDGCSNFQIFSKIFLPLSKPISITLGVAFFIANWNNYLWPLIVNQNQSKWVLQVAISSYIGRNDTPWNAVMAAGGIAVIPTIIIFFVLQRYLVEGIKMNGLK
jgi:multiple sugar transport system permease protein